MSASIWDPSTPAGSEASAIPFDPTATLAATNVQAAIEEADTENRALSLSAQTTANAAVPTANLASSVSATLGAALAGFSFSLAYAASTVGWATRLNRAAYNVLQDIPVAEWAAIIDGTSTTDLRTYITTANTAAKAAGLPLFFPPGIYPITPTAVIELGDMIGAGPTVSKIKVNCTSYNLATNVVFQVPGSTKIEDITIYEDGLSKLGCGLKCSATNPNEFTGHQRLVRVWIQGFLRNLDVNNIFMLTADQCRFESGTEGVYCAPVDSDSGPTIDDGYVTTHTWNNCFFFSNTRNVYYSPALNSVCVSFYGGSIEAATGSSEQAYFTKLRVLTFAPIYLESASGMPALRLLDVAHTTIDGAYMNGTGGIALGTNAEVTFRNVYTTSSTDVLTGGDGTQKVSLEGCAFPNSGNSAPTLFAEFNAFNSVYNGISYKGFHQNHAVGFSDDGYSASITTNLRFGNVQRYVVNNGSAFTINAPTNAIAGTPLRYIFKNTSGGAMGAITWNAVFKVPTLTLPATGFNRTYEFLYDGTNWLFQWQSGADVPN